MAEATSSSQVYDLLILTDATSSMDEYLHALNQSLPKIISISALTGAFARIGVMAYRDYCRPGLLEWSGWFGRDGDIGRDELLHFMRSVRAQDGGDWPEATKTGLASAYSVMREDAKTLVLLYADAPPHMGGWDNGPNYKKEIEYLTAEGCKLSPSAGLFADWVSAARTLNGTGHGAKQAQIFSIVCSHTNEAFGPFMYMSHQTKGTCIQMKSPDSPLISKLTMSVLLAWMGVKKAGEPEETFDDAFNLCYNNLDDIDALENEKDPKADIYFVLQRSQVEVFRSNICQNTLSDEKQLRAIITPRDIPVTDFAKRYVSDEDYRKIVVENLSKIIREDVSSITLNPVFGALWRAVCNDRRNEARNVLIADLGVSIANMGSSSEKSNLQTWLAESYNYAAEIAAMIEEVPLAERFPCVFLDPTQHWHLHRSEDGDEDDQKDGTITSFTCSQLLEIGRSCDSKILRRLGTVLTRLTYVTTPEELPNHVMGMKDDELPRIPIALAKQQHNRVFWKILLHLVVPGIKLGARPAALLAALSIRMGMRPLMNAADYEMAAWKDKWNNINASETWNADCLALILDADKSFEARRRVLDVPQELQEASFLSTEDRHLFETLVDYGMLMANLNTTLTAKIGWKPTMSKVPIGPLVVCKACHFPRSVSMMAHKGICGKCITPKAQYVYGVTKAESILMSVSQGTTESHEASFVECRIITCRAQYVVYNVDGLKVHPKCYYCRFVGTDRAPWVECRKCLNRMIWPHEYRPLDQDVAQNFLCSACNSGRATIVDFEITLADLCKENGDKWLLRHDGKLEKPFEDRSLFKTVLEAGIDIFAEHVEVLPQSNTDLRIDGKIIHNAAELKSALTSWIKSRRTEAGLCNLCFSNFRKSTLRSACGRSGCGQRICRDCKASWYSMNSRGRIINTAALCCPFCRRVPSPRAVPKSDLVFLGNLKTAVEDSGAWIYAWCCACSFAERMMERVCAQGAPPEVRDWECEDCSAFRTHSNESLLRQAIIRHCPRCDVATKKLRGFDHISCGCGAHWCFFCCRQLPLDDIYRHMANVHGGLYDILGAEDDDDVEMDLD
ncbi:hypothetical protein PFICI_04136 [Pestalotiopsis fici W106-1]|uniref:RING-type domain-containing protein n=1 Tax=Pestalotiopsis fici (strain W106-1 / CGMCC3.15140) TaxID=1229662 RepID=W3XLH1_PESFW|nr:uncharacterized protein PFICI_04136 [Pestalotiopsis fici W106-1]ETS86111.1 hypothetical protein PFICI_04136 [Pestalotiopsis fici W106-1]